jgi:hypothetical protein
MPINSGRMYLLAPSNRVIVAIGLIPPEQCDNYGQF